jgi:predicted RNA binding protein YcfA (HicA-like mRNA interferase family)
MRGRLPSCTAADVARALERGGFVFVHQKGSHRYFADPITGDILTTVPMHVGDISRSLLKKIIKDVGLTEQEFRRLL